MPQYSERLARARNNVLLAHAALLGVLEDEHLLDGDATARIGAALADGGGMAIESIITRTKHGIVAITTVAADGERLEVCTLPDAMKTDMQ